MSRLTVALLVLALLAAPHGTQAQQSGKVPRIGLLGGGSASASAGRIDAFRQGLRDLGYM